MTEVTEQREKEQQVQEQEQSSLRKMQPHKGEPAGIKKASLIQRIITGAIFAFVMLAVVIFASGTIVMPLFCILLAILGVREFYRLVCPEMKKAPKIIGAVLASVMPLMAHFSLDTTFLKYPSCLVFSGWGTTHLGMAGATTSSLSLAVSAVLIALLVYMLWMAVTPDSKIADIAASLFGALYLGIPLMCFVLISAFSAMGSSILYGFPTLMIAIVVSIWAADSFAYLGGSLFGRHKIAPIISPKKSWEGLAAGILGAVLAWYLVYGIFDHIFDLAPAVFMGIIVSFTSLIGDLFQSRLKREAGVKDSGTLLPGHGGVLDRFDSLLFTLPVVFLLVAILDKVFLLDFGVWLLLF